MNDPDHKQVHKVNRNDLDRYKEFLVPNVEAVCGKIWAPKLPLDLDKPDCPECFATRMKFAIAA